MMECTSSGSTLFSCAAFSTISEILGAGTAGAPGEAFTGATLRTSFPVRRSARTTNALCENVFWLAESVAGTFPAADNLFQGEAASIMASAVIKQIYIFLSVDWCVNVLAALATIFSCGATRRGSCWPEDKAPAWARTKRFCRGKGPL